MVLASYFKRKWEEEANEKFSEQRRRNKMSMWEWARENGIPIDKLPESRITSWEFGEGYKMGYGEGYKQGVQEGTRLERQRLEKATIRTWAEERNIPLEELPEIFR